MIPDYAYGPADDSTSALLDRVRSAPGTGSASAYVASMINSAHPVLLFMAELSAARHLSSQQADRLLRGAFHTSFGKDAGYHLDPPERVEGYPTRRVNAPHNGCVALVYLGAGYLMQVLGLTGNVHRFTNRYLTALAATA